MASAVGALPRRGVTMTHSAPRVTFHEWIDRYDGLGSSTLLSQRRKTEDLEMSDDHLTILDLHSA